MVLGPKLRIRYVNPGFSKLTGYSLEEVEGKLPDFRRPGATIHELLAELKETVARGELWTCVFQNRRKDGSFYWERAVVAGHLDASGAVAGYVCSREDITDLHQAEAEMKFERSLLQGLLDALPDAIYFKDVNSRYLRIGRTMARDIGLKDPAEAIGKTDSDFFHPKLARAARLDELNIIRTGKPILDKIEEGAARTPPICASAPASCPCGTRRERSSAHSAFRKMSPSKCRPSGRFEKRKPAFGR